MLLAGVRRCAIPRSEEGRGAQSVGTPARGGIQIPSGTTKLAEGPPRKTFFAPKELCEHSARFPCLRPLTPGLRCSVSRSGHAAVVQFFQRAAGTVLLHNYEQEDARALRKRRAALRCSYQPAFLLGFALGVQLSHGLPFELDAVGAVHDAVADGVGDGRIADRLVPAGHRKLRDNN